jgi:ribonuclease Z
MMRMRPPTYAIPRENEAAFRDLLDAWRRLDRSDLPCEVRPVGPGDVLKLDEQRVARVFRAIHRVPSVGYALCRRRRRLADRFAHVDQEAVRAAARAGEAVTVDEEVVEVAFCGDTTIDVVDREPLVRSARLLILEVTFLDERVPVEKARAKGHVHLDEVIERADRFENEVILMTHRSQRYGDAEAERLLDQRLPAALRERTVLLRTAPPWVSGAR